MTTTPEAAQVSGTIKAEHIETLRKMAEQLSKNAENAERMCELLQPEFDKFEARAEPHNVYVVRDYVDHRNAAKRQRKEAEAILAAIQPDHEPKHTDDEAVDRFAAAMKTKLRKKRAEGRSGWDGPECDANVLTRLLRDHVEKGDPLDVGNLSMMLHQRGERIQTDPEPQPVEVAVKSVAYFSEYISEAAVTWCGQKDRETFPEDIAYFKHNWSYLPGLWPYVIRAAVAPSSAGTVSVEAAAKVISAYDRDYPMRTADQHRDGCDCLRCSVDALRALAGERG